MKEVNRALDAGGNRVRHLDHDAGILRLHHVLVGGAAIAQVIAELDAGRYVPVTKTQRLS
jgi:hypothetical protein